MQPRKNHKLLNGSVLHAFIILNDLFKLFSFFMLSLQMYKTIKSWRQCKMPFCTHDVFQSEKDILNGKTCSAELAFSIMH